MRRTGAEQGPRTRRELRRDGAGLAEVPLCPSRRQRPDSAWPVRADGDLARLQALLKANPCAARSRAADGRGPLFWAYEYQLKQLAEAFTSAGADPNAKDTKGKRARDMTKLAMAQWPEPTPKYAEDAKTEDSKSEL